MTLTEQRRANIRRLCKERRIRIEAQGERAFRLVGHGVDILASDLSAVFPAELEPTRKPWARGSRP